LKKHSKRANTMVLPVFLTGRPWMKFWSMSSIEPNVTRKLSPSYFSIWITSNASMIPMGTWQETKP